MRIAIVFLSAAVLAVLSIHAADAAEPTGRIKAGLLGLDTSHVIEFPKLLNNPKATGELADMSIVAGYPGGSPDLPMSRDRVKGFTEQLRDRGVEIVDSIDELLKRVDVVLLTSVDGRVHWAQARQVIEAGKPLFIDKPMADTLADAMRIFRLAKEKNVPCFSASSLRFGSGFQAAHSGMASIGPVRRCVAWSSANLNPSRDEPFWFHGIHGVEILFTVMGPGCQTVTRVAPGNVEGVWKDGRQGSFFSRENAYGAAAEGANGAADLDKNEGYAPLLIAVVKFFKTGKPPVSPEETLEILAFMDAADASQVHKGEPVSLESVLKKAEAEIAEDGR
jgi:predicted dehydrogenase